jgi:hypothetical protein
MRTLEASSMGPSGSSEEFYHTLVSAHTGARKHGNCESHKEYSMFHLYNLKTISVCWFLKVFVSYCKHQINLHNRKLYEQLTLFKCAMICSPSLSALPVWQHCLKGLSVALISHTVWLPSAQKLKGSWVLGLRVHVPSTEIRHRPCGKYSGHIPLHLQIANTGIFSTHTVIIAQW